MQFCGFTCELIGGGTTKAGIAAALKSFFPSDRFSHFAPIQGRSHSIRLLTTFGGPELAHFPAPLTPEEVAYQLVNEKNARFLEPPHASSQKGWMLLLTTYENHRAVLALATWVN